MIEFNTFSGEETIRIEAELSDELKRFLNSFKGMRIPYNTWVRFQRRENIKAKIL